MLTSSDTPKTKTVTQTHAHAHAHASTAAYRDGFGLSLISLYPEGLAADNPSWTVQIVGANSDSDTRTTTRGFSSQMHGIEALLEKKHMGQ